MMSSPAQKIAALDHTHDPAALSWVESANDPASDFCLQNLPFGQFRVGNQGPNSANPAHNLERPNDPTLRIGVAIGHQILDLAACGLWQKSMESLLQLNTAERIALRHRIFDGLKAGSPQQHAWSQHLIAQADATLALPCTVRNYTDFYSGIHHARAVGRLFRPDNPLLPNYHWVPIAYHGRASTVYPSGRNFYRPHGQILPANAVAAGDASPEPVLAPSQRLDFELELGLVVGRGNVGADDVCRPIPMTEAEDHLFGIVLLNDWSARDIQAWEYQPLGPFLAKNFASTVSPWLVTMEALAPFRTPFNREQGAAAPLPYLTSAANQAAGAINIQLEVALQTAAMSKQGLAFACISRSDYARAAHWTAAQLLAHHSVGGCRMESGDLLGTGTLSGSEPEQAGSLLELTRGGKQPIKLPSGETRTFLQDGDSVRLRGFCSRDGFRRLGFGLCSATVLPAPEI